MYINDRCYLPSKNVWRQIIIRTIEKRETDEWLMRMRSADFSRFSRLHRSIQPCTLYFYHNSGLPSYKIVFIAKLWTTIPENKPRRCDLCGRVILDNIKHRLVECASTYSLKSDLLEDLYRNVSAEICNE